LHLVYDVSSQDRRIQMRKNKQETFPDYEQLQDEKLAQEKTKNRKLREEREVLKKAIAILLQRKLR
jgi:hypothetical protein